MTDTTDIAALTRPVRDRYDWSCAVWRDCDHCGKQHTGTVTAGDGSQICAHCADQIYWSAWQVLAERALDQLETERQQAAETNNINLNIKLSLHERMVKAEKEVAALKGGLQPVGEIVAWAGTNRDMGITREVDFRFLRFDVLPGTKLYAVEPAPATIQLCDPPAGVVMRPRFEKPEDCECSSIDYCESCLETMMSKPAPAVKSDLLTRAEALAVETRALASRIQAEE